MTNLDIARQRLLNQRIASSTLTKASNVVRWLGAVQAQDYGAAKWAIGLRAANITEEDVEQAITDGAILRTHVMRPTWHFVAPADIRWMLALTAPRVHAINARQYGQLELTSRVLRRCHAIIERALQGEKQLTHSELATALRRSGVITEGLRLAHIIMHAELEGLICSGPRRGKQFTYALLHERAPHVRMLKHDEALAELTGRYFTSHGPATLRDYSWWSGLSAAKVKAGLEMVKSKLSHEVLENQTYWFDAATPTAKEVSPTVHLLPNYDEYVVGYTDRSEIFDASHAEKLDARANPLFQHTIVLDGRIAGTWKRTLNKASVVVVTNWFSTPRKAEQRAFAEAARRYGAFLGLSLALE